MTGLYTVNRSLQVWKHLKIMYIAAFGRSTRKYTAYVDCLLTPNSNRDEPKQKYDDENTADDVSARSKIYQVISNNIKSNIE